MSCRAHSVTALIGLYVGIEVVFYFVFHLHFVPKANQVQRYPGPATFRGYESNSDRHKLLLRILERLQRQPEPISVVIRRFLLQWFVRVEVEDHCSLQGDGRIAKQEENKTIYASRQGSKRTPASARPPSATESDTSSVASSNSCNIHEVEMLSESEKEALDSPIYCSAPNEGRVTTAAPSASAWTINEIDREHVNELFSWAFFGTSMDSVKRNQDQQLALNRMHAVIRDHVGLDFRDSSGVRAATLTANSDEIGLSNRYQARQMTLEPVNVLHRPLLVYMGIELLRCFANTVLRFLGFRRVFSTTGLVAWYRPPSSAPSVLQGYESHQTHAATKPTPLLFFHGIAPAGHVFYLPMILWGLAVREKNQSRRPVYIFENPNISGVFRSLWRDEAALNEPQTVQGVQEILDETLGTDSSQSSPVDLAGHSFGSVPLTWLLHSRLQSRIRSVLLIDPVTILLSEPDVMINFLYSTSVSKIRMLASSELGIQVYLRRHFAWYNAELWLQDVPAHVKLGVALSEHDEILNAPKVRAELQHHHVPHLYWKHVGHAHCVTAPSKWKQMRDMMTALTHPETGPSISITSKKSQ